MTATRPRASQLVAVLGSSALALGAVLVAAPSAHAAPQPRTFTTSISPTSAVAGVPTAYAITVKNTSTVISAMDHVSIGVPAGFTVVTGSVTAPRGGWTESLDATGTVLTARATKLLAPVLKGESLTLSFTATDTTPCDTAAAVWTPKADGVIIDPYVPKGASPSVQMSAVADRFAITSVTDVSAATPGNQVVKGQGFSVAGEFRCGGSVAPAGSAGTVTLVKSGATPAGGLGGTTSTPVAAGDTTAAVSGATYDTTVNGVGLVADWTGGADDSTTVDVVDAAASANGVPGTPLALTVPGASAGLPNGANGPVALLVAACDPGDTGPTCSNGTQIELTGNFKDLYTNNAPASVLWTCPATDCRHLDHTSPIQTGYSFNYECLGSSCQKSKTDLFGGREVEEDFADYPVYVSLQTPTGYTTFAKAGRCVPLPTKYTKSSDRYVLLHQKGKIVDPAAQAAHFCVDVNAITRANDRFDGELRIPVLFVEDPRIRP